MRPVEGFLAFDGTFHETEQLCRHYEANRGLLSKIKEHPVLSVFSEEELDNIYKQVVSFIIENGDIIRMFLDTLEPSLFGERLTRWDVKNLQDTIVKQQVPRGEDEVLPMVRLPATGL